jgi:hypothetical protein
MDIVASFPMLTLFDEIIMLMIYGRSARSPSRSSCGSDRLPLSARRGIIACFPKSNGDG